MGCGKGRGGVESETRMKILGNSRAVKGGGGGKDPNCSPQTPPGVAQNTKPNILIPRLNKSTLRSMYWDQIQKELSISDFMRENQFFVKRDMEVYIYMIDL